MDIRAAEVEKCADRHHGCGCWSNFKSIDLVCATRFVCRYHSRRFWVCTYLVASVSFNRMVGSGALRTQFDARFQTALEYFKSAAYNSDIGSCFAIRFALKCVLADQPVIGCCKYDFDVSP